MRIPFSIVFALLLSLDTFAAPVPNAQAGDEFALEVRKAKVAAKKPVKAPVKAKPVAKKPVAKPAAKKPVAKPAAKKPVTKPAAKKPVAKPAAKKPAAKPAAAKKPAAKPAAKKPAAKPAAKPVAAKKPTTAAKKPATTAKKPTTAAKKPTTATKKPATAAKKPVTAAKKPTTAAKKPTTAAKKPAAPAKKPTSAAPAKKPPTKSAAKPAASAKPSKLPKCTPAQIEAREFEDLDIRELELEARASVSHPSGTGSVTLFHGTTAAGAASLASSGVDLSKTRGTGDFNHKPEVAGGFYLTDSLVAAAQFACYGIPGKKPASVDVVEFKWSGSGKKVHTFPGETADWKAFQQFNQNPNEVVVTTGPFAAQAAELFKNDMIEGPLNGPADVLITDDFQQYAVIKQDAATNNLKFSKPHQNILCKNVPTGNKLTAKLYQQGQAGNAKFNSRLTKLQNAKLLSGTCVIQ